jgi:hypothetical protein
MAFGAKSNIVERWFSALPQVRQASGVWQERWGIRHC